MSSARKVSKKSATKKASRGTRGKSVASNMRVSAENLLVGDKFVMNGQKPAVVIDSRTFTSVKTGDTMTNVMLHRADGGLTSKTFNPTDNVLIVKNASIKPSVRNEIATDQHIAV